MSRLGLSLSGGGFRATLFHLGVVRYLKDAGVLPKVTHVVSVSGGSIIAAHLVLNWDRYNGSDKDFDEAAGELLRFVHLDLRNCIVRRIPFQLPLRFLAYLFRMGGRRLTVNGLMEAYLDRYLYGGRCLHELPAKPELHILATNVSEGGLCSFRREGLVMQHRRADGPDTLQSVPAQLAPISLAVAASAAFPGFFPPIQIRAADIGAKEGEFAAQALTDGGVYDNLGVRAYHWMIRLWAERNRTLAAGDLANSGKLLAALAGHDEATPAAIRWLAARLPEDLRRALDPARPASPELLGELATALGNLLRLHPLHQQAELDGVPLDDPQADALRTRARAGATLDPAWQAWLNRHLLSAALKQALGADPLPPVAPGFDEILVSDAGQPFLILSDTNLGFIAQSMRATDILWDRVWQLERENFGGDSTFRFIPINHLVPREEDPTALHPVVQSEVPMIRTDLDRFSPLETRALVGHGYEVARSICAPRRSEADKQSTGEVPAALPPWDPFAPSEPGARPQPPSGQQATDEARTLRRSSRRRIWSTLLDWRDWPTYVFVPLLLFVFVVLPVLAYQFYQRSLLHSTVLSAVSNGMPDFKKVMELIDQDPEHAWKANPIEEGPIADPDYTGWELLSDTRIVDLRDVGSRGWFGGSNSNAYYYIGLRVRKLPAYQGDGKLRLDFPITGPAAEVRVPAAEFRPVVRRDPAVTEVGMGKRPGTRTEVVFDLAHLAPGGTANLEVEFLFRDMTEFDRRGVRFTPLMPTEVASVWLLFPTSRPYKSYSLTSFPREGAGEGLRREDPRYQIDHPYGSVIAWSLTNPDTKRIYECAWEWK